MVSPLPFGIQPENLDERGGVVITFRLINFWRLVRDSDAVILL
jgi:hypothetical protein